MQPSKNTANARPVEKEVQLGKEKQEKVFSALDLNTMSF